MGGGGGGLESCDVGNLANVAVLLVMCLRDIVPSAMEGRKIKTLCLSSELLLPEGNAPADWLI